ncbi:hypothetical protein [Nostoc sp.]
MISKIRRLQPANPEFGFICAVDVPESGGKVGVLHSYPDRSQGIVANSPPRRIQKPDRRSAISGRGIPKNA